MDKVKLEARLTVVITNARVFVDYTMSGRGGVALLIPSHYSIVDNEASGTGNYVWATVITLVGRDFNMVELPECSMGKSALLVDAEAKSCRWKWLMDSYICARDKREGDLVGFPTPILRWVLMEAAVLNRQGGQGEAYCCMEQSSPSSWKCAEKVARRWIRIREILRIENRQMKAEGRQIHDLRLELRKLSNKKDDSFMLHEQLKMVENNMRKIEQAEAWSWLMRRRQRWLREGEAMTTGTLVLL
ncbi:hypothetical protein R1sor_020743 [Riccia sorocarpa]|uniref:Uncharacterized protein n=1 Tax=Riccia sorocarpa TaxID=122646 RepID=A0ABD3GGU0_9MARC